MNDLREGLKCVNLVQLTISATPGQQRGHCALEQNTAHSIRFIHCLAKSLQLLSVLILYICRISLPFNSLWKLLQCGGDSVERPFRYLGQGSGNWQKQSRWKDRLHIIKYIMTRGILIYSWYDDIFLFKTRLQLFHVQMAALGQDGVIEPWCKSSRNATKGSIWLSFLLVCLT